MNSRLLRQFVPPVLHRLYRLVLPMPPRFHGVYAAPGEAPDELPFESPLWLERSADRLDRLNRSAGTGGFLPARALPAAQLPTALIVNLLSRGSVCRVLDFAGGSGAIYFLLHPFMLHPDRVVWDVVDDERLAELGRRHCTDRHRLQFLKGLPEPGERYDVVHINTSLQYVHEPYEVLARLLAHHPRYVILTRLLAGDVPTWVTAELLHGRKVPCTILNVQELVGFLGERSWELAFKAGAIDELIPPIRYRADIPAELRIPSALHLVFERTRGDGAAG